jgi:DNA-binding GntR family transcriptional regulator
MNTLRPSATSTQFEQVFQRLHDDIIRCKLAPDTKLSIVEYSKGYGVGATPLREALSESQSGPKQPKSKSERGYFV